MLETSSELDFFFIFLFKHSCVSFCDPYNNQKAGERLFFANSDVYMGGDADWPASSHQNMLGKCYKIIFYLCKHPK